MPGRVIILTGPPGAGKTTLAGRLTARFERAAHLHSDDFYDYIKSGFIPPWLPESRAQNETVSRALAAAVCAYATGGYQVVMDGIVGPWFLGLYREAARQAGVDLHYVVLRPDLAAATIRARDREVNPLAEYPPNIYRGLSDLGDLEPHAFDTTAMSVEQVLQAVTGGLDEGRFRLG